MPNCLAFLAIWAHANKKKNPPPKKPLQNIFCWKFRLWFWGVLSWNEDPRLKTELSLLVDLALSTPPEFMTSLWKQGSGWMQILWIHVLPNIMVGPEYFISCLHCGKVSSTQLKNYEQEKVFPSVYIIRIHLLYVLGPCIPFTFALFLFSPKQLFLYGQE